MAIDFERARQLMIEQQVRPWEVLDPRVLDTLSKLHREDFVPPQHRKLAFADFALPLAHGEVMMKPVVEGRMLQALDLAATDSVLEIGTGSGFITACLAKLACSVRSIDIHEDFLQHARARLNAIAAENVRLEQADVFAFSPDRQFDAICVTAAVTDVPSIFLQWLKPHGRMFIVRGVSPVQEALRVTLRNGRAHEESLFETDIPYLHGAAPKPRFAL